jgi:hypothetical protein
MTPEEAFKKLVEMAETGLARRDRLWKTSQMTERGRYAVNKKFHALLIGAEFIVDTSGSWPAEEQIKSVAPDHFKRFLALCKQEGL